MAGARCSLPPTASSPLPGKLKTPRLSVIHATGAKNAEKKSLRHPELEDGEIMDEEIDKKNWTIEKVEVDASEDSSTTESDTRASYFRSLSLREHQEEPLSIHNAGSSAAHDDINGDFQSPSISQATNSPYPVFTPHSEAHMPDVNRPGLRMSLPFNPKVSSNPGLPVSPQEFELAKEAVLDLLGWGVEPEYLIECGISSHAIYRIFTDLHLRLPSNLSYSGSV